MPGQDLISLPPYSVVQPGAYSSIDASQIGAPNPSPADVIPAILGVTAGGAPNKALYFSSPAVAFKVLRSGPAYDCARFAFDGGASQVCVVRVGNPLQGTLDLAGASGVVVTLTSRDYGTWVNGIKVTVAAGPIVTITARSALGVTYTETYDLSGIGSLTAQIIADAINGARPDFQGSNYVTATTGAGTLPLATTTNTPLANGSAGGTPSAGDWTNGLTVLETQGVDILVPAISDASVHAQVLAHCQVMSSPSARMERTAKLGGALGENLAAVIARQVALADARESLVYPGIVDYDATGKQTLYDPFYAAAKVAGLQASLPDVATSLIHQRVPCVDVEVALSTAPGKAVDKLLAANITPIAPAPDNGFWVVDSLTGYTGTDAVFRDVHKVCSADYVSQFVRARLEDEFVGAKNLAGLSDSIEAAADEFLDELLSAEIIIDHDAPQATPGPNVTSQSVQLPVMLVDTNKYIFINVELQPSSTVTNSVTAADALS